MHVYDYTSGTYMLSMEMDKMVAVVDLLQILLTTCPEMDVWKCFWNSDAFTEGIVANWNIDHI